jgi:teichuronic acid biosynthesis glycosyltransferase TuaC
VKTTPSRVSIRFLKSSAQVRRDGLSVLFVTNMYPSAASPASGTFVQQQAEHLERAGNLVDVLHVSGTGSWLKYLSAISDVRRHTRRNRYDIVHAHYGLSGIPAAFRVRTPLVVTLHGSDALVGRVQPLISKAVCAIADAVIPVSSVIAAKFPGCVIPCGIDLNMFAPRDRAAARARLGVRHGVPVIVFPFSSSRRVKRYDLARAAVDALGDPSAQLLTVDGIPNADMPWYYNAADVMILCSDSEGSPTSVKEALACNVPVVSTDVGDVRDILQGVAGCEICPRDNAMELTRGLKRVLARVKTEEFCGRPSMARYDHACTTAAIVAVYRRVLEKEDKRAPHAAVS